MTPMMPYYFFWLGAYLPAHRISLGSGAYSRFVSDYLKEAGKESSLRSKLAEKFRGVPELSGKSSASSRPAAKKPAPKKPAPKKAPAKKPAAKKK